MTPTHSPHEKTNNATFPPWREPRGRPEIMRRIVQDVARESGLSTEAIMAGRRVCMTKERQTAMARIYATGQFSLPRIGRFFNRHHATVLHAVRASAERSSRRIHLDSSGETITT